MDERISGAVTGAQTILVVDDDPSTLSLCSRRLQAEGYTVLQASGSSEALQLCVDYKGEIHLLVADLLLPPPALQLVVTKNKYPRTHGQELVHRVVALKPQTRVLLISAYTDDKLKEQGVKKDALPFLQKPFPPDTLAQKVRETLAGPPVILPKDDSKKEERDVEWFD